MLPLRRYRQKGAAEVIHPESETRNQNAWSERRRRQRQCRLIKRRRSACSRFAPSCCMRDDTRLKFASFFLTVKKLLTIQSITKKARQGSAWRYHRRRILVVRRSAFRICRKQRTANGERNRVHEDADLTLSLFPFSSDWSEKEHQHSSERLHLPLLAAHLFRNRGLRRHGCLETALWIARLPMTASELVLRKQSTCNEI